MNNDHYAFFKNTKTQILLVLIIVIIIIIGGQIYRKNKAVALKDSVVVDAVITDSYATRDRTVICVQYIYGGVKINNKFTVVQDTFKIQERVLLRVAKKYPDKYIEFIKKIKSNLK